MGYLGNIWGFLFDIRGEDGVHLQPLFVIMYLILIFKNKHAECHLCSDV